MKEKNTFISIISLIIFILLLGYIYAYPGDENLCFKPGIFMCGIIFNSINYECKVCDTNCNNCRINCICIECLSGYFLDSGYCYGCNINCKTKKDNCKCKDCYDGYYLNSYSQCIKCDSNCTTCSGSSTQCTGCNDGYFVNNLHQCQKCNTIAKLVHNQLRNVQIVMMDII